MPDFYAVIKPTREDFIKNPTYEDNKKMSEHFQYLKGLLEQGKLVLAGPVLDEEKPKGIYVLRTDSEEEARNIMKSDPAITAGVQKIVEFWPFRASLYMGMETK